MSDRASEIVRAPSGQLVLTRRGLQPGDPLGVVVGLTVEDLRTQLGPAVDSADRSAFDRVTVKQTGALVAVPWAIPGATLRNFKVHAEAEVAGQARDDEGRKIVVLRLRSGQFLALKLHLRDQGGDALLDVIGPAPLADLGCAQARLCVMPGPDQHNNKGGATFAAALDEATKWESRRKAGEAKAS